MDSPSESEGVDADEALSTVNEKLPDSAAIDAEGLLYTYYSSRSDETYRWSNWGINVALLERQATDEDELDECHGSLDWETEVADPEGTGVTPEQDTPQDDLRRGIEQSWTINIDEEDRILLTFHEAAPQKRHNLKLENALRRQGLITDGKELIPAFQKRCFTLTMLIMYREFRESRLTAREFVSHTLTNRFDSAKSASLATHIFGEEISSGAIRSSASRVAEKKRPAAEATVNVTSKPRMDIESGDHPNYSEDSLLSTETLTDIVQFISGVLETQTDSYRTKQWEVATGINLIVKVDIEIAQSSASIWLN